jgi:RTA1 like protein
MSSNILLMLIQGSGVGLQLFFICIFIVLATRFQQKIKQLETTNGISFTDPKSPRFARRLLYVIYAVLLLIIYRNIYRLIEFSAGVTSKITTHEWYLYVFDTVPMFFALLLFNAFHPGRFLRGERSDFSEENRILKAEKKEKKRIRGQMKDNVKRQALQMRALQQEEKRAMKEMKKGRNGYHPPLLGGAQV